MAGASETRGSADAREHAGILIVDLDRLGGDVDRSGVATTECGRRNPGAIAQRELASYGHHDAARIPAGQRIGSDRTEVNHRGIARNRNCDVAAMA